jgi:catechol 2,3-dioxygenase-like lactoylglutathione lyase family enzyme
MRFLVTIGLAGLLTAGAFAQGPPPAPAQAPAPVKGATTGFMHAIHATNNVETTLAFYQDVFGLNTKVQPFANPGVPLLTNSPGVNLRVAMLRIPGQGFNFELTEFTNTERKPAQPRVTDPGAPMMKFFVKDIDAVVAAAKKRNATFITPGGTPVNGAVFMRDPDGYIVAAVKMDGAPEGPGNVTGSEMVLTVADMDAAMKFWRDLLGWEFAPPVQLTSDALRTMMGLTGKVGIQSAKATVPGSTARFELLHFTGVKGTPFDLRVPDPGASGMAIRVAAIQELLPKLKASGVRVISKDQALVEWDAKTRNVFVKDPNGLLIELVGTVTPPAK